MVKGIVLSGVLVEENGKYFINVKEAKASPH
jgi:hypothetical protein